ncbi:TonB-dependent siderophore receptor [Tenacibaculum sp. Bg11-29]|uniref:TonB-dependent siderophore receptor n=1 Tax=Tenacibaculum sp. Bg11-29 TaxID=2058306 RepID=UPI000C32A57D|nr:TonB-dependent siderophore receptor [Tenacibaculum sp. Bg11-29]PKH52379.1 TonB-dependent siderophore receptor [Tenacibaculum sp. Bg11-29]
MNKRQFILTFIITCLWSALAVSQTGNIKGRLLTNDNQPAKNVAIYIKNSNKGTVSNENGNYEITNIPVGLKKINFSIIGLNNKSIEVTIIENKTITIDNIVLNVSQEVLNEITITSKRKNKFNRKETKYVARLPLKNIENPQVYSVITSALLEEIQAVDVEAALLNAPGINNVMKGVGSGGTGIRFNMRGFSADIAMRNGVSTAFVTGTDPANLERLEVIKGPSGTLFGNHLTNSYGGVVNRVTKKAHDKFKGTITYNTGSNSLSRISADINTPLNKEKTVLFRVNAAKHNEHSFQDYGLTRNLFVSPTLTYKPYERLQLTIEGEFYKNNSPSTYFNISRSKITNIEDLNYNFDNSYGSDYLSSTSDSYSIFAEANYKISDNWESQTIISSSNVDNNANYLFLDFFNNSEAKRRIMNITSQFYITQIQQNIKGQFKVGNVNNKLLVGIDNYQIKTPYRRTQLIYDSIGVNTPQLDFNSKKYEALLAQNDAFRIGQRDQSSFGVYASNVTEVTQKLSIMASLRVDWFNNKEDEYKQTVLSPKFGAVYQIVKDKVSVFANYMDGFKNVAPEITAEETTKFNPEYATQIEAGIKSELFNDKLSFTLSYYDIIIDNAVRWENNKGDWSRIQDGKRASKGFEAELIANPFKGWNLIAGYGYNDSEYLEGKESIIGNTPYASPETTLNFWTSYKLPRTVLKGLGFGFGLNHTSDSFLSDRNKLTIPGNTVINSSLFYDHNDFRIGLKFNNITNEKYWANMGANIQPQRTKNTVITFSYKF